MACERGLNRNLRGFCITNFPHHDDIRVLAKYGAQAASERHIHAGIHLRLSYAFQFIFHGIFYRQNITARGIKRRKNGVERGAFPGARWPRDQNNTVGKGKQILQTVGVCR